MNIAILCSDENHPVMPYLQSWIAKQNVEHSVSLCFRKADLSAADVLFLVSCQELIGPDVRQLFRSVLVLHASALPAGRGWSPHIWQILAGSNQLTVTLLEANDPVDSGAIWATKDFALQGHELYDEINATLFQAELELMDWAVSNFHQVVPRDQLSEGASYWARRRPEDSQLDPQRSIADQFDQLRVADPERYPAFFDLRGCRYRVRLEKEKENKDE